jgi:hypothetical protein
MPSNSSKSSQQRAGFLRKNVKRIVDSLLFFGTQLTNWLTNFVLITSRQSATIAPWLKSNSRIAPGTSVPGTQNVEFIARRK